MNILSLPWEVRSGILTSLLVLPIPIQSHHDIRWLDTSLPPHSGASQPGWDPWKPSQRPTGQILRTCRQLHDEGLEMLYRRNTFCIVLLTGLFHDKLTMIHFLNHADLTTAFARYPALHLATKFAVDFHFDPAMFHYRQSRRFDPSIALAGQMRQNLPPRLDELAINFHWIDTNLDAPLYLSEYVFYQLRFLRAGAVAVTGVLESEAERFIRAVGSWSLTLDLEVEYRRLCDKCDVGELARRWAEHNGALRRAATEFDLNEFRRVKELILAGAPSRLAGEEGMQP